MQLFIFIHVFLFYLRRKKTFIFKYMNSSNVSKCEARLKIYLYPHMKKLLQWLPGYEEWTDLLVSVSEGVEGRSGIVVGLPFGTIFRGSLDTHIPSSCYANPLLLIDWFQKYIEDLLRTPQFQIGLHRMYSPIYQFPL